MKKKLKKALMAGRHYMVRASLWVQETNLY
jgi:hypothetical protein